MSGLERIERYIAARREKPMPQLDDVIHGVHMGSEWEAELRLSDVTDLAKEVERLREALTFYSKPYFYRGTSMYMCGHSSPSHVQMDGGAKAREALSLGKGEGL